MSRRAKRHYILGSMLLGNEQAYLKLSASNHRENTKEKSKVSNNYCVQIKLHKEF
jgi:hypothetical protein